jgi:hypothetical protein
MNTTILREEIQWLLEAINEQYEVIKMYEDKIPQIEFDILMDNVRKLYENLHLVNRTNDPFSYFEQRTQETTPVKPLEIFSNPSAEVRKEEIEKNDPVVCIRYDDKDESSLNTESSKKEIPGQNLDLFSDGMPDFSGKLKEARHRNLAPKTRKSGNQDLKASISINEKFLFINELFDGNLREYNENIEALNRFSDFKSALEFLDLLRKKNLWNSESVAFNKLRELLEQRFQ